MALVPDADGNFYGTTYVGGANGDGVIYKLIPVLGGHWNVSRPQSVTFDPSGNLFIATYYGGLHVGYDGYGVVLEIAP